MYSPKLTFDTVLLDLGLSEPNRNRSATTVSHDIHMFPDHTQPYNLTAPLVC